MGVEELFREQVAHPHIKMVEIKLSQGAKPGVGGELPGRKVDGTIARIAAEACASEPTSKQCNECSGTRPQR